MCSVSCTSYALATPSALSPGSATRPAPSSVDVPGVATTSAFPAAAAAPLSAARASARCASANADRHPTRPNGASPSARSALTVCCVRF
jgi:hypothetical protein